MVSCVENTPKVLLAGRGSKFNEQIIGILLGLYWGYIGVVLRLYWDYIGIMEKKIETTGIIGII